jgi:hypothetical protein
VANARYDPELVDDGIDGMNQDRRADTVAGIAAAIQTAQSVQRAYMHLLEEL